MNMLSGVGATRLGGVEGSSSSVSSSLWSWWYASNSLLFTKTQKGEKRGENVYGFNERCCLQQERQQEFPSYQRAETPRHGDAQRY